MSHNPYAPSAPARLKVQASPSTTPVQDEPKVEPESAPPVVLEQDAPPVEEIVEQAKPAKITPPPKVGPGSGTGPWREFAAEVTNSPLQSWDHLGRNEIIELLESQELIGGDDDE